MKFDHVPDCFLRWWVLWRALEAHGVNSRYLRSILTHDGKVVIEVMFGEGTAFSVGYHPYANETKARAELDRFNEKLKSASRKDLQETWAHLRFDSWMPEIQRRLTRVGLVPHFVLSATQQGARA